MLDRKQAQEVFDHDVMRAKTWWKNASEADRKLIWDEIQRQFMHPVSGVMARFAQIGYTLVMGEMMKEQDADNPPKPDVSRPDGNGTASA